MYETGARPNEPFDVKVRDVDFETEKIRLGILKYRGDMAQRELPISPLLAAMLRDLTHGKGPDDHLFFTFICKFNTPFLDFSLPHI